MRNVLLILATSILLSSCYSLSKAKTQFAKASISYPEIPADYCARTYPAKDSIIKGDSVVTFDTLWGNGVTHFDTVYSVRKDTVFITKVVPGKTILQTIHLTDTIYQENRAALDLCEIERRAAVLAQKELKEERDGWKGKAKTRFYVMWGLVLLIVVYAAWKIYSKFFLKK